MIVRNLIEPWRPRNFPYGRFLVALAIAIVGGVCFALAHWPLAWMIGPMVFCAIAALMGAPVRGPLVLRAPALIVVGTGLGASFSPDLIRTLPAWLGSIGLLLILLIASVSLCYAYFRWIGRLDPTTAYFAAVPGGLNEMILAGEHYGGDVRAIATIQSLRVILTIILVPFIIRLAHPFDFGSVPIVAAHMSPVDALTLIACAIVGVAFGIVAKLPARYLLGPLIVSALAHGVGLTSAGLPTVLLSAAQVVIGLVLGCRFVGANLRVIGWLMGMSLLAALTMVGLAWGMAAIGSWMLGVDVTTLLLSYAPGGVAEMSLAALALHIDAPIVAAHHLVRITILLLAARLFFSVVVRRSARRPGGK